MEQSKLNELIKNWEFAVGDKNFSPARDTWMSEVWNETRDEIEEFGYSDNEEIKKLDRKLLEDTLKYGTTSGDKEKPLKKWWWHLDEIAQRTYPADLLPEHLKEIYIKYLSHI